MMLASRSRSDDIKCQFEEIHKYFYNDMNSAQVQGLIQSLERKRKIQHAKNKSKFSVFTVKFFIRNLNKKLSKSCSRWKVYPISRSNSFLYQEQRDDFDKDFGLTAVFESSNNNSVNKCF